MAITRRMMLPLFALTLVIGQSHAIAADALSNDPLVGQWIKELDSDQFDIRESATRHLILTGTPAVDALTQAAQQSNAEVTWRAVHALSEIAVAGDFDNRNLAEDSLAKLKSSSNPSAATRAAAILLALPESRQGRAIAMLQSLGGHIDASGTQLQLDAKWEGKDNGLRYIRHVPALRQVQVEPEVYVTDEGIKKLRSSLPEDVRITQFGSAFIGVGAASNEDSDGMRILTVHPNSPAAKAGLQQNDVITQIDKSPIGGFDDLVAVIRKKKVGQEITVEFSRTDPDTGEVKNQSAKVTLGPRSEMVR